MRLPVLALLAFFAAPAAAQFSAPDAAPSTPVDEVVLLPFEPTREDAVLEAYVDGVVGAHRREYDAPAVAVSVVRGGRTVFAKAYGEADVETHAAATGETTLFRIGSVSKTFIWTTAMMLAERGSLDLDADVNTYLKGMQLPEAFGRPVTMNDLMAHRAGFEDTLAVFKYRDDGDIGLTQALIDTMPKRVYAPGARTSYSNWGAALASKIVEDIAGVPYADFVEAEILKPLAMTHTTFRGPKLMADTEKAALAKGYSVSGGKYAAADYLEVGPFAAAGAMSSSAADMARWSLFHLNEGELDGVRLMRADTHRLMTTRAFNDRPYGADLAHGLMARPYRGVDTFGHGGATALYFTYWMVMPELDAGMFVSQSATESRALPNDLPWLIMDQMIGSPITTAPDDPAFEASAPSFAGAYLGNRRSFSRFEKLFAVADVTKVSPAKGGGLTVASANGVQHYAPVPGAADTFENMHGSRVVFGRDAKGHVDHFSDGSAVHSYDRIGFTTNPQLLFLALGIAAFFGATTWMGAWRRLGRSGKATSGVWSVVSLAASGAVFIFIAAFSWMAAALSDASPAVMLSYPPPAVTMLRVAGYAVFAGALAMLAGLWPVWRAPWGLWRKAHHSAFALSLGFLAVMIVVWKAIFSATV
ncbi:MAG: serine hydrolase domain-containing protein [Parvularculaceae bacterium]